MTNTSDATIGFSFSGFRLDSRHKKLFNPEGELVTLSTRPFDVLLTLLEHHGKTVSRELLMEAVWPNVYVEEHNLTQAISIVRKALNDTTSESQYIRTAPGRGYCFIADVERIETGGEAALVLAGTAVTHAAPSAPRPTHRWRPLEVVAALSLVMLVGVLVLPQEPPVIKADTTSVIVPSPLGISEIPRPGSRIRNSIAVLPFATLSLDNDKLFALGLHDEIISQLTKNRSLNVIGRSSVVTLLEQGFSTLDITRVLRVESILSGTIRQADAHARVSLQLVDARSGVTLWSGTYDINQQDLAEMISIQGDIAVNVATALKAEIPQREQEDFATLPTELIEAYRYNLAAHSAHDRQNYAAEWRLAQKAIALDPDFYDALDTFASANVMLVTNPLPGMTSRQHSELALEHANRMIALAPERSEAYALKAVTIAANKDWAGAAAAIDVLEEVNASLSSLEYVARVEMAFGHFEKAIAIYEANLSSELLNPNARGFLVAALEMAGRRDEARRVYEIGQELHSQWWGDSVNVLLALGRNEPVQDIDQLVAISDELKQLLARTDDTDAILAALAEYQGRPEKRPIEARYYAALAADLGEHELAVELLRASMKDVWRSIFWAWLPVFDATRQQESFRQLLRDSGLVSYWELHGWPRICQPDGRDFRCDWRAYPAESVTLH